MNDYQMFVNYDLEKPKKPRYRIQWEFTEGKVSGYYVFTQKVEAIKLHPSFFIHYAFLMW